MSLTISHTRPGALSLKYWQLGMVFVLALTVFIVMRWQPGPWLRAEILRMAEQQHVQLSYSRMVWHGLSADMADVRIQTARMTKPLMVKNITVRPLLSMLWSGHPAARIGVIWRGQQLSASLRQQDDAIDISDIEAAVDIAALQPLWQGRLSMQVDMQGRIELTGNVRLNGRTGQPVSGRLAANWKGAKAALAGMKMPLGDYRLSLHNIAQAGAWQWQADGGQGLNVRADGKLMPAGADPRQWHMSGQAELAAGEGAPQGLVLMLGNEPVKLQLSGTLQRPQWKRL
ncbi:MAG: hypothetical protein R8L58_06220 [Mariprofundaceae bacterium]